MSAQAEAVLHDLQAGTSSTPWWRRRMLGFDFESTGPDPLTARPVQCAAVLAGGDNPTVRKEWLVDAGVEIPEEASKIHGIYTADIRAKGMPLETFLAELVAFLREHWTETLPLCGMNCPYDLTLLAAELRRAGGTRFELPGPVVDVKVLDKQADVLAGHHRRGSRKLADLCFHYNAVIDGAHDASNDALAAVRVAYRIGQRFPSLGKLELAELHRRQISWHREQAESLQAYWIKKGDPKRIDSFEWPVRTLPALEAAP